MINPLEEVPPNNREAEQAVLGSMLISQEAARVAVDVLKELDFYDLKHRQLYNYFTKIYRRFGMVDEVTAAAGCKLEETRDYLGTLQMRTPSAAGIEGYCATVLQCSGERAALLRAATIIQEVRNHTVGTSRGTVQGSISAMEHQQEQAKSGQRFCVPLPWPQLHKATRALLPGTITALCGSPGASKSLMLVQFFLWAHTKWKCALLGLEDGTTHLMHRALAQLCGRNEVTQDEWWKAHAPEGDVLMGQHKAQLEPFGKVCYEVHRDEHATMDFALDWVEARAAAGCRVIAIDPFTFLDGGEKSYSAEKNFIVRAIRIMETYKASLLFVTHPKKAQNQKSAGMSQDDVAGSASIRNHSRCILWYQIHDENDINVKTDEMVSVQCRTVNRTMHVLKANNSFGARMKFGFYFDKDSLTVKEQGIIE